MSIKAKFTDAQIKRIRNWGGKSDVAPILDKCSQIWRFWLKEEFDRNSAGGGEWPRLKRSTIQRKIRKKAKAPTAILKDEWKLYKAVQKETVISISHFPVVEMGQISSVTATKKFGIGHGVYKNRLTVDDVADIHQRGAGRLPPRPVFKEPPPEKVEQMEKLAVNMILEAWRIK